MTFPPDADANADESPSRELDDLITRHLDGGLDAAGQRHLAGLLAASPAARRTLAGYLRLEAATIRLASAGLFGQAAMRPAGPLAAAAEPGAKATGQATLPLPHVRRIPKMRRAVMAIGGGLLAAAVVALLVTGRPPAQSLRDGDLDLLASRWVELQRDRGGPESEAADTGADADDDASDDAPPPGWLVAALIDEASGRSSPDDS